MTALTPVRRTNLWIQKAARCSNLKLRNKETDIKLQLLQNRIKNLKREESKARWKIEETIRKGEILQKIRRQKQDHTHCLSQNMMDQERQRQKNNRKINLMRSQIMHNILSRRNDVYNGNRQTKNEVSNHIKELKSQKRSTDKSQYAYNRGKRLSIIQGKQSAKMNNSLELYFLKKQARQEYDDKINLNLKISQHNLEQIKELERLEAQLVDQLKETYQEHDNILKQYDWIWQQSSATPSKEFIAELKMSPRMKNELKGNFQEEGSNLQSTDLSQTKQNSPKQAVLRTQRQNRSKIVHNSLVTPGVVDQNSKQ
jgi:hypothetical protein